MSRVYTFLGALLGCCAATCATLQQLSLDQMSQAATAIVQAKVVGSSASYSGSTIYTHYTLQVSDAWKGFVPKEVMVPGGTVGGSRQAFPGVPQLTVGSEYVLFLWTSPSSGITHLVGLSQGLFSLSKASDGSMLATRPLIGELILDSNGQRVADHAIQMPLSAMKGQVSHALIAGAPQ